MGHNQSRARSACGALRAAASRTTGSESESRSTSAGITRESAWRRPRPTALARTSGAGFSTLRKLRGPWAHPQKGATTITKTALPIHRPIRTTTFPGSPAPGHIDPSHPLASGSLSSRVAANSSQNHQKRQCQCLGRAQPEPDGACQLLRPAFSAQNCRVECWYAIRCCRSGFQ